MILMEAKKRDDIFNITVTENNFECVFETDLYRKQINRLQ